MKARDQRSEVRGQRSARPSDRRTVGPSNRPTVPPSTFHPPPQTTNHEPRTTNAFTIIEILGVLLLLSILIAMLVSVVGLVQRKAQQCRAQADANALVQAVLHYQQVYGAWPGAATNGATAFMAGNPSLTPSSFPTNTDLAAVIAALAPNNPAANPKQLLFLTAPTNALGNGLSDPWGNSYLLVMGAQQCVFQYGDLAFSNLPAFAISAGAPVANSSFSNWIFSAGVRP